MKITKIRAVGPTNVDFPIVGASASGPYVLKGADGLGPVEVTVLANGKKVPATREMVLLIGLQPDWNTGQTPEELRMELYGLLTPRYGSLINLQFMDGSTVKAYAEGQIKKMEVAFFDKDPVVQITFGCLGATKSYFLAPTEVQEEPTLTSSEDFRSFEVDNDGTAPSGFWMEFEFTEAIVEPGSPPPGNVWGVRIYDVNRGDSDEIMLIRHEFAVGDRLRVDTRAGSRNVWHIPDSGPMVSIIEDLDVDSTWLQLHSGVNEIGVTAEFDWVEDGFRHTPAYWGI
jgi:hypothetical protein